MAVGQDWNWAAWVVVELRGQVDSQSRVNRGQQVLWAEGSDRELCSRRDWLIQRRERAATTVDDGNRVQGRVICHRHASLLRFGIRFNSGLDPIEFDRQFRMQLQFVAVQPQISWKS